MIGTKQALKTQLHKMPECLWFSIPLHYFFPLDSWKTSWGIPTEEGTKKREEQGWSKDGST